MSKLKFDEFKEAVVEKISEYLPETFANADVCLNVVTKNNDLQLTGLVIRAKDSTIAPSIYLEQFFEEYEKGEDINVILQKIADLRVSNEFQEKFDVDDITDFDRCKKKILPRLIGQEWNQELLRNRPNKLVADLAVTYCIMLSENGDGSMSVPITNELMKSWNVSAEDLYKIAMENMDAVDAEFASIGSVIGEMLLDDMGSDLTKEEREQALEEVGFADEAMFVLTNRSKCFGAVQVLSEKTMKNIVEKLGGDFYILPSSIHEVLIVPMTPDMSVEMLREMVRSVNETQVAVEERLSENVYVYTENGLEIAQ